MRGAKTCLMIFCVGALLTGSGAANSSERKGQAAHAVPAPTATTPAGPVRVPLVPTPARSVILAGDNPPTTVSWASLSQERIRSLLDLSDEDVTFEQVDTSGHASFLTSGANLQRGRYRITYYYYRYRNEPCVPDDPLSGAAAVGVGIRVIANVETNKSGLNLGQLIPLAMAADRNQVSGKISVQVVGITSGTTSLQTFLQGTGGGLTMDTVRNALASLSVVKAVADTSSVTLSPNYMWIEPTSPGQCLNRINAAP